VTSHGERHRSAAIERGILPDRAAILRWVNYLAHLFLSHRTPEAVTGALLGDFVKGSLPAQWSPALRDAVLLHRAIDRYTDGHAAVAAGRLLISRERRRFAGILVDVFFDHFLARRWSRYSAQPLAEFTAEVYAILLPQRSTFPERLQHVLPRMARDDWLASYAAVESVDVALNGIARRFRHPERATALTTAVEELRRHYPSFEALFAEFFPQLQAFVARFPEAGRGA
jgi:acyl carrier protein phosphodiesterase